MGQQINPFILSKSVKTTHHFPARHQASCSLPTSLSRDTWRTWDSQGKVGRAHGKQRVIKSRVSQHATLQSSSVRKPDFISSSAQARKLVFPSEEMLAELQKICFLKTLVWHQNLNTSTKFFQESTRYWYNFFLLPVKGFRLLSLYLHAEVSILYMT